MTAPAVTFERVSKSFFGVRVVNDVSFSVAPGRVLGLVGENGAGKSTLMNILGGVLPADTGRMSIGGVPYAPATAADAARHGIAFIHQELNLFANLSVAENMFLAALPRRHGLWVDRRALHQRTRALLAEVELDIAPETPLGSLTPGERQLVEIARALSRDARVVIFDEPTTSLTSRETTRLFTLIERLRAEGRAIIYISHALQDVLHLADDVLVLRDGEVTTSGPRTLFTADKLIAAMVGRSLDQLFPPRATRPTTTALLEARGLSQPGIIENVSFTLHAGEVLGIAGLMGAGRTELARILFGLDPHTTGELRLQGEAVTLGGPRARIARKVAFLTESRRDDGLLLNASVADNVALAAAPHFTGAAGLTDRARLDTEVTRVARAVRIAGDKLRVPVRTLSGGNQQKAVLARWLLTDPGVFILDEPTRGIDVGAKHDVYSLINELVAKGSGVLVISSELEELIGICDRILVMRGGEITGSLDRSAFDRAALLRLAFGEEQAA